MIKECFCDTIASLPVIAVLANDVPGLKESEEKLKQQQQESARRENILVMRLATKEQEMQECTVLIYPSFLLNDSNVILWKSVLFISVWKC